MTLAQAKLVSALRRARGYGRVQSFERQFNNADVAPNPNQVLLGNQAGEAPFTDQFTIQVQIKYFTVAAGVYTNVAAAAIQAALKTFIAAPIFGFSDAQAGYAKFKSLLPVNVWLYEAPFVYGRDYPRTSFGALDATALAFLQFGDMVQPFTSTTGGVNTVGLVIVRLVNGYYANLLNSLSSDIFQTNLIRYQMDSTLVAQFNNPIQLINQSLFGAAKTDNIDPTAYKQPQQFQAGIIDIKVFQTIYKAIGWGTYVNYDCILFTLSVFVRKTDRLQ